MLSLNLRPVRLLESLVLALVLVGSGFELRAANFDFSKVPDGFPVARASAPYGAFGNAYDTARAREYQEQLDVLERKMHGMHMYSPDNMIEQAKLAFYLENLNVGVITAMGNDPVLQSNRREFDSLMYRARRLYRDLRTRADQIYEIMIRAVDVALPGASGPQIPVEVGGVRGYLPNCRLERCPTEKEREEAYKKGLENFLAGGGRVEEMFVLTQQKFSQLQGRTWMEYAVRMNGELWVTEGKAGHLLLAAGQAVQSSGQIMVLKDRAGKPLLIVVTNASGTYKPDLEAAENLAGRLAAELKVPLSIITTSKGEPLSTQNAKVLMKAENYPKDRAAAEAAEMVATGNALVTDPARSLAPLAVLGKLPCTALATKVSM